MSSDDTLNPRPRYREEVPDEGYTADNPDMALNSDEEEYYDDSSDSDGGLVMSRRKSAAKAPPDSTAKDRRDAALPLRSKKSSRSGSSNTMKKVRSQDSENEQAPAA
jgi:[calcium/calmodulin-dependent protein kinase] kinase